MTTEVQVDWEGACPFCGGLVTAEIKTASLYHASPFCNEFVKMDTFDFLAAVRNPPVGRILTGYVPKK